MKCRIILAAKREMKHKNRAIPAGALFEASVTEAVSYLKSGIAVVTQKRDRKAPQ